jgi:hypothetical protein
MHKSQASLETWQQIKKEYLTTPGASCRTLAEKYGLPVRAVAVRCAEEKWRHLGRIQAKRDEVSISGQLQELPRDPEALAKLLREDTLREGQKWIARIESAWENEVRTDGVRALKDLVPLWQKVRGIMAEAAGPPPARDSLSVNIGILSGSAPRPVA